MKSKKLISKVSVLTLAGITILGSSSSLYAKSYSKRPSCSRPSQTVKPGSNCGSTGSNTGSNSGNTNSKPGTNCGNTESDNESNSGNTGSNNGSTDSTVTSQTAFENKVLELVNAERAKNGLSALQMDESVRKVARVKSSDMSQNNYFSHTSPTYGTPFEMLKSYGISYKSAGENIAQGYTSPEAVVNGWMNSSGHRANILNASYTHIGIGYEANGNYWTQMFIGK